MKKKTLNPILALGMFLMAVAAFAEVSAVSDDASLDTRTLSGILAIENQDLDTRSCMSELSADAPLNTKEIIGTILLMQ